MDLVFLILEIIGTISFTISGTFIAISKNMDIFGVGVLGVITAVGGGIIRDIILGINPPNAFSNPIYLFISIITTIIILLPPILNILYKNKKTFEIIWLIFDTIGLGTFTVIGVKVAYSISNNFNLFLLIFVGVITGVGGGALRDVLAGQTPFIFIKHFYASASIIGAFTCSILWGIINTNLAMAVGGIIIVVLRLIAAKNLWSLPKPLNYLKK